MKKQHPRDWGRFKIMGKLNLFFCVGIFLCAHSIAQFAGPVGSINTTAMYKDSSAFKSWAKTCTVIRGYKDVMLPDSGFVTVGHDTNATKKAGFNPVVSLGDGGIAVLTFDKPIKNGPGYDFAVFENSFSDVFLELAFVEVSSDGLNYKRFPATSNTQTITQIGPFDNTSDATKLNNLAGKYRGNYGTPFDLQELALFSSLNINAITHVRIIDVVGKVTGSNVSFDNDNKPINDPYPTLFASGGFDLDAVGVIHEAPTAITKNDLFASITIYPNPAKDKITIRGELEVIKSIKIISSDGKEILKSVSENVDISSLSKGFYFLEIETESNTTLHKKITKL